MEEHREVSRAGGESPIEQLAAEIVGAATDHAIRRLREDRRAHGDRGARSSVETGASARSCRSRRSTPRAAARSATTAIIEHEATGARADVVEACALRRRPGAALRGRAASPPATACARSCRGAAASRRWRTTPRRTCCTRRCARCSATTCKQAGSAVRPDKLRFDFTHRQALTRGGARARRAARQREGLRERCPVRTYRRRRSRRRASSAR